MSSRVGTTVEVVMENEETLLGRMAKLPFGIIFIILFTGGLSYYFEQKESSVPPGLPAAEVIQRTIMQRQMGTRESPPAMAATGSRRHWYWLGGAVLMQGAAGVVVFRAVRRKRHSTRQRRGRPA